MQTLLPDARRTEPDQRKNSSLASRFFWVTVLILAVATIGLTVVGGMRSTELPSPAAVEFSPTTLERLLSDTAIEAKNAVEPDINELLDAVYGRAYAAIPAYADFHYSVLGEYVELTEAVRGQMSVGLYERLFDGFEQRLTEAASVLDQRYVQEYQSNLQNQIAHQLSTEGVSLPLGDVTDTVLKDAIDRVQTTLPLATASAGIVGSGSLKVLSATIAKKLAAKVTAKASAKGLAKGGGVLTGAGGGALLCSWSGPGAALCGIVGGAAAWFLTDAVVVNIDEYFNREDFEAELRAILDEDRAEKNELLAAALEAKAAAMDALVDEIFKMRDLSVDN